MLTFSLQCPLFQRQDLKIFSQPFYGKHLLVYVAPIHMLLNLATPLLFPQCDLHLP